MMLIDLKCSVEDRFAFNTLKPFRKIPVSERRLPIVTIPWRTYVFRKATAFEQ